MKGAFFVVAVNAEKSNRQTVQVFFQGTVHAGITVNARIAENNQNVLFYGVVFLTEIADPVKSAVRVACDIDTQCVHLFQDIDDSRKSDVFSDFLSGSQLTRGLSRIRTTLLRFFVCDRKYLSETYCC